MGTSDRQLIVALAPRFSNDFPRWIGRPKPCAFLVFSSPLRSENGLSLLGVPRLEKSSIDRRRGETWSDCSLLTDWFLLTSCEVSVSADVGASSLVDDSVVVGLIRIRFGLVSGSTYVTCSATNTSVSSSERYEEGEGDRMDWRLDDRRDSGGA